MDLGVNTLIAATDGRTVLLISSPHQWTRGQGDHPVSQQAPRALPAGPRAQGAGVASSQAAATAQVRHARQDGAPRPRFVPHGHTATRQDGRTAGRQVADAFPNATCYVGEPFNEAAQHIGRVQAQSVSQACTRKLIGMLDYKTAGAMTINEAYSSQTCPVCGERSKQRRIYRCPMCGANSPRDAIGAANILSLGTHGAMLPGRALPAQVKYLRPWPRSRSQPRSRSGGHPARSSAS